jgi:hypothetical protein
MLQRTPKPTRRKEERVKDTEKQTLMDINIKELRTIKNNILIRKEKDRRSQFKG